jgi:hypothetical protein
VRSRDAPLGSLILTLTHYLVSCVTFTRLPLVVLAMIQSNQMLSETRPKTSSFFALRITV